MIIELLKSENADLKEKLKTSSKPTLSVVWKSKKKE